MRRLWMSLLIVPVVAVAVPTAAWASPAAPAARSAPAAAARALQPGMSGAAVKTLQRRLAALKYYPGSIDGHFGASRPLNSGLADLNGSEPLSISSIQPSVLM